VARHGSALENFTGFFEERVSLRVGGVVAKPGELLESLFLGGVEVFGNFDADADMQIAPAAPGKRGDALIPEAEDLVRGGPGGNFEIQLAIETGDADLSPKGELGKGNRNLAEKVVFLAFKDGVGTHGKNHVKIAGGTPAATGLTLAGGAEPGTGVDSRRDF